MADEFRGISRMHEFRVDGHMHADDDRIGKEISGYSGNTKEKHIEISRLVPVVRETHCQSNRSSEVYTARGNCMLPISSLSKKT